MFKLYDIFRLKKKIEDEDIPVGSTGTVLMIYEDNPPAYEVEFVDENGRNIGNSTKTFTLTEDCLEPIKDM